MWYKIILFVLCLPISGCLNLGTMVLPPNRLSYNRSLVTSDAEQNLLNIVRLRYSDAPYFLSINNIVSQFSFAADATGAVTNAFPPPRISGTGNIGSNYSESPTITYTPLQGEEFVTKLLTPIDLSVLYMMLRSGWSMNHVFRLCVQKFGSVENAVLASRTTSNRLPIYKEFLDIGLVFLHLQHTNNIDIFTDSIDKKFAIRVEIRHYKKALNRKQKHLLAKFGVSAKSPRFWLTSERSNQRNQVFLETRTVYGLLNYLSKSVDIPEKDYLNKQAPMTYYANHQPFDWHAVTIGMGEIKTSRNKPEQTYVMVKYRGSWFYIDDTDYSAKESFNILGIIMGIYQGKIQNFLPVFTVS